MSFPEPKAGLVIRYSYLWRDDHLAGREEGTKDRPCAVVAAVRDGMGDKRVLVIPVTHTPPENPELAIEIPLAIKRKLRLDDQRSWIVLSESNEFRWPGPDLRPIGRDDSAVYGVLPADFFKKIQQKFIQRYRERQTARIKRTH